MNDVRALAALSIASVMGGEAFNGDVSDGVRTKRPDAQLRLEDRALYRELVYGTLRLFHRLDHQLAPALRKPMAGKDADIRALLLLGLYQLQELRTPDHAAIHASVNAARALKKPWACALINAVLRKQQRGELSVDTGEEHSVSAFSHPAWLLAQLQEDWPRDWQHIAAANNCPPQMTLRINRRQITRDTYRDKLADIAYSDSECPLSAVAIHLKRPVDVADLPGFDDGMASVQDSGAQLAASLLDASAGHRILDACAAPGGKTAHLLEQHDDLKLVAVDNNGHRLQRVRETLDRLGLHAQLIDADAAQPAKWWDGEHFDRILLDAPCSGTGVINHHPDIKLLRKPADIKKFAAQQLVLLQALWATLAPGGQLLYCTCSILRRENEQVIAAFLTHCKEAQELVIDADWGQACQYGRQLLPNTHKNDGFFYARLSKLPVV